MNRERVMTKRVAIYARVSTNDQSCERQLVELREVAENHNWEIAEEYIDHGISGAKTSRPQLDAIMKDAFSRKFEMVMTLELSRMGRNTKHLLEMVERLKEKSINLYIHNQQIDTSTATGSLFFTVASAFTQFERDIIAERVKSGVANYRKKNPNKKWGGRKSNLTPETAVEILTLNKEGVGIRKLSKQFSVSTNTIYKVIKEEIPFAA